MKGNMEVFETVGLRHFSATLELDGLLTVKEGDLELTRVTVADALATLAEKPDTTNLLDTTIDEMLRTFIKSYARAV
ncbi:hypothetical protein ACT2FY_38120 [Paraburkholderia fungorum]|uniref:hypothetical protein n=1 Tax=Paraburkholderia fungorum TaxID=134537 RepID=UPI00402B171E